MNFCAIYVAAPDNSSHQIYIYGGRDHTQFFDDVYVLTMPAFVWVRLYQNDSVRAFHRCHLVGVGNGQSQMLSVGGTNDTDFEKGCDWEDKGVAIYNLNTGEWGPAYEAHAPAYVVPDRILNITGGT